MARAIMALKYCIYGRARMAQSIMALKYCWQCQNGSSHSCMQVMPLAELECQLLYYSAKMTQAILARSNPAVLEWLEPFRHSRNATGHARMAQAIIILKSSNWQLCDQNGSSHSCTQVIRMTQAIMALNTASMRIEYFFGLFCRSHFLEN